MKKGISLLAVLLMACLMLTACGDRNAEGTPSAAVTTTPAPTETIKPSYIKSGDVYRYIRSDFQTTTQYLEEEGDLGEYIREKHYEMQNKYGITIEFVICEADWMNYMCRSAYSGNPIADIGNAGGPFALMQFYKYNNIPESAIYALSDLSEAATFSDPDYWELDLQETMCTFDGKLYFANPGYIGWELLSLSQVTFFNKRLVEQAGYSAEQLYQWCKNGEWTWDKYRALCEATTDPSAGVWGSLRGQVGGILYALVPSNDGEIVTKKEVDGKMYDVLGLTEEKAQKAYEFYADLASNGYLDTSIATQQEGAVFATGQYATMVTYLNRTDLLGKMEDDYGILLPPKGPDAKDYVSDLNWCTPLCIFKNISNPLGTAQVLEEFFAPRFAKSSAEAELLMEADLATRVRDSESMEICKMIPKYSRASTFALYAQIPGFSEKVFYDAMDSISSGSVNAATYFASIEEAINANLINFQQVKDTKK